MLFHSIAFCLIIIEGLCSFYIPCTSSYKKNMKKVKRKKKGTKTTIVDSLSSFEESCPDSLSNRFFFLLEFLIICHNIFPLKPNRRHGLSSAPEYNHKPVPLRWKAPEWFMGKYIPRSAIPPNYLFFRIINKSFI